MNNKAIRDLLIGVLLMILIILGLSLIHPFDELRNVINDLVVNKKLKENIATTFFFQFATANKNTVILLRVLWTFILGICGFLILYSNWKRVHELQTGKEGSLREGLKRLFSFSQSNLDAWVKAEADSWDLGLLSFACAMLVWSLAAITRYCNLLWDAKIDVVFEALLVMLSIANSLFIALGLPYIQLKENSRSSIFTELCRPSTLVTAAVATSLIVVLDLTIQMLAFEDVPHLILSNILELFFTIGISLLIGYSLWLAFGSRQMKWEKRLAAVAISIAVLTSVLAIANMFKATDFVLNATNLLENFSSMAYKTILVLLFIQIGLSWESIQQANTYRDIFDKKASTLNEEFEKYKQELKEEKDEYISELKAKIDHLEQQSFDLNTWSYSYSSQELDLSFYTKSEGSSQKVLALLRIPSSQYAIELDLNSQPAQLRKLFELAVQAKTQTNYGYITVEDGGPGSFSHKQYSEFIKALTKYLPTQFVANFIEKDPNQTNKTQVRLNVHPNNILFLGLAKPVPTASEPNSFSRMLNYYGMSNS